jgi:hypothetical protein
MEALQAGLWSATPRPNPTDVLLSALRAHGSQQQWKLGSHFRF